MRLICRARPIAFEIRQMNRISDSGTRLKFQIKKIEGDRGEYSVRVARDAIVWADTHTHARAGDSHLFQGAH